MKKKPLPPATAGGMGALVQKTLVRYAKTGPAIYYSHHDMMRFWERAARRANLPLRLTQGFNPHPRLIFPQALGVGIPSRHEAVIFELCAAIHLDKMRARLTDACAQTLEILSLHALPPVKQSPQLKTTDYQITGWSPEAAASLPEVCACVTALPALEVQRGEPGKKRAVDIRPYIASLTAGQGQVLLRIAHTPTGSARADEVAAELARRTQDAAAALLIEKTGMELE